MDKGAREALGRRILALAGTGEHEAVVTSGDDGLTRFAHNAIHQNVARSDASVQLRTIVDGRSGVAAGNAFDDAGLRDVVERAAALSALAPRDDVRLAKSPPASPSTSAFVASSASASPAERARDAGEIFGVVEGGGLWAAGYVRATRSGTTVANSLGTLASFDATECGVNVKANGDDSTGYAERYVNDFSLLAAREQAAIAAQKTLASCTPRAVEPGDWTVILEPPAFGEIVAYLTDHFSAQAYDEGSSFLSDGLGRTVTSTNFSLTDDWSNALAPGMPFDYEGTPKERVALIERGVAKAFVTDAYWARKLGRQNTGHALPAPNAAGPQVLDAVVSPGTKTTAQLIAETARGLLVSRLWYVRTVDQRRTIVTGMTRDGTFLIENGKIAGGVRNMRFNQSILAALGACEMSSERARTGGYSYSMVVPAAKFERFTFTSTTDF
ncbi:MAG: TldD/PmbA family protein [Candidatus Eremiobacteraeota bacterium]|nr:TldD/PmbA family protein [Candidatus Eremiobacteraeota bacterium]